MHCSSKLETSNEGIYYSLTQRLPTKRTASRDFRQMSRTANSLNLRKTRNFGVFDILSFSIQGYDEESNLLLLFWLIFQHARSFITLPSVICVSIHLKSSDWLRSPSPRLFPRRRESNLVRAEWIRAGRFLSKRTEKCVVFSDLKWRIAKPICTADEKPSSIPCLALRAAIGQIWNCISKSVLSSI